MISRRGLLGAILATAVSPAIVRAASLMPTKQLASGLYVPERTIHVSSRADMNTLKESLSSMTILGASAVFTGDHIQVCIDNNWKKFLVTKGTDKNGVIGIKEILNERQ